MTRFHDSAVRPPKGSWGFPINGVRVVKHSETEIVAEIARWRKNNGTYVSDEAIREELWEYLCGREPERCGRKGEVSTMQQPSLSGPLVAAPLTPALQGPPIWTFLNVLAAQWSIGLHNYFLATCDAITVILDCPDCRKEWIRLLSLHPPAGLSTRLDVCQWVNKVHNLVNARVGKQPYPYAKMVIEFGAPPP